MGKCYYFTKTFKQVDKRSNQITLCSLSAGTCLHTLDNTFVMLLSISCTSKNSSITDIIDLHNAHSVTEAINTINFCYEHTLKLIF